MTTKIDFLFKYLKKNKINIDQNEFNYQIQSHPDYPSLLSITDTLDFFKIKNIATEIDISAIEKLPNTFIALIQEGNTKPFLSFVERKYNGFHYSKGEKYVQINNKDFDALFCNVVLFAKKTDQVEIKIVNQNLSSIFLLLLGATYLSSILIEGFFFSTFLVVIFALIGVYLSNEAISHELGINTKFSDAVCTITTNSDCDAVLNSEKPFFLTNINFSDISITFFVTQLFGILFLSISNLLHEFYCLTFISLLFSIPFTIFSFYQQIYIAKKWCPICLAIIFVLYAEVVAIYSFNSFNFLINIKSIIYYSLALIISFILCTTYKKLIKKYFELKSEIAENNRFKRNYSLFKMALTSSNKIHYATIDSGDIILGNHNSKLRIIVVTSPFCVYCKDMHANIEEILKLHDNQIAIHLRFNFNPVNHSEESRKVHAKLVGIYFEKGENEFIKELHNWFSEKNIVKLCAHDNKIISDNKINSILTEQYQWNQKNDITFTPAVIINEHLFPSQYDRKYLVNFINDLKEDESFQKG